MKKQRCKWLGLVVLSLASLLVMGGCGGSSSSSAPPAAKAAISGTVTFPSLNSLVGKRAAKSVAKVYATPTVQLRTLGGDLVATATVTGTGEAGSPFTYSFSNLDSNKDYVVKAFTSANVIKAIVDKGSLSSETTRNIDTVSTTAVIVTEQKLGAVPGTIGEKATTTSEIANAAKFSTTAIAEFNPLALENKIYTAIGTVNNDPTSATQTNLDLVNLVNVVAASVYNDVNPSSLIAGTATLPPTATTTQYTLANVATGGDSTAAIVQTEIVATLSTAVTAYTPPPADTVTFTSRVMDYSIAPAVAAQGVEVTANGLKTYTDASGFYTLAGITKNTTFYVKMSKAGYADSYSAQMNISANSNSSTRPYSLYPTSRLAVWGNFSGASVITARVVDSTNLETGYIAGAVVTATDAADSTVYPVTYTNATTGAFDPALTNTAANGSWMFRNVPAGRTVVVTATKSGYTFAPRTFVTVADSVCQGRITGTAVPIPPTSTSATKAAFQAGLYEIDSEGSWNGTTNTPYWFIDRISIASDGFSLQQTMLAYLDPNTSPKEWTLSAPVGFPTNNSGDYQLTSSGSWLLRDDGPTNMNIAFNADGSARLTSKTTSMTADLTIVPVDISGQTISSIVDYLYGLPTLSTAGTFPSGSVRYDMTWNQVSNDYSLWDTFGDSLGTTDADLSTIPGKFVVGSGMQLYIDSNSAIDYYAQFASASSNVVSIYQAGVSTPIGTGTYAITTVFGRQIGEVIIPAQLRTQYKLGNNPIFALGPNGFVMHGDHSAPGISYENGGNSFNSTAVNHLKTNMDISLAKPALAKKLSRAVLGM